MGHPLEQLLFGVPRRSGDNRLWTRYPQGDAPNIATASGAGVVVTAAAPLGSALGSNVLYPWDAIETYAWVDPSKTSSGDGSINNPLSPAQALSIGPASVGDRVIRWLPGDYEISAVSSSGYRFAAVVPTSGASSTRRVIHQALYPGSTAPGFRTRIRRTGGGGSILGFFQTEHAIWDGFMVDTKTLLPETSDPGYGEAAQLSAWFSDDCKFIRMYTDHQGATYLGSNRANLFIQYCDGLEIGDSRFTNIGSASGVSGNIVLVEIYDSHDVEIHHCELWNGPIGIWSKAQHDEPNGISGHRYHHNIVRNCGIGIAVSNPIQTTVEGAHWVYQNLVYECQAGIIVTSFGAGEPKGILIVNNTLWRMRRRNNQGQFYGTIPFGLMYINATGVTSFVSDCLIVTRNNALYDIGQAIYTHEASTQYNNLEWDRNSYNTYSTGFWRETEGGALKSFSQWQGAGRDLNGLTAAQGFVDAENNDMRPGEGSILIGAGRDYLQLLGGSQDAECNIGAHMTDADVFGPRLAA